MWVEKLAADVPEIDPVVAGGAAFVVVLIAVAVAAMLLKQPAPKPAQPAAAAPAKPKSAISAALLASEAERDTEEDGHDVTKVTKFTPALALPRLTEDRDEDDEEGERNFTESKAVLVFQDNARDGIDEPTGPQDLILTSCAGNTDRGVARKRNEDSYLIDAPLGLYAVADGMGGYAGGDVASKRAVEELHALLRAPQKLRGHEDRPRRGRELIAAIERANEVVHSEAQRSAELTGMGTTMLAARFSLQKQRVYIAHVGDSRCYRLRAGELSLLTRDHTLGEVGVTGPLASNIRRAVGVAPTVKVDLFVDIPLPDDRYLLCSDGLSKMVKDEDIKRVLLDTRDIESATSALIAAANENGGRDNITVVLIGVRDATTTKRKPVRSSPSLRA
jgi:serine/threonine protein phosphatase PrpC